MNNFDIAQNIKKENPVLNRSNVINGASGRYCIDQPILNKSTGQCVKLEKISHAKFDDFIHKEVNPKTLVCIALLDNSDSTSRVTEQIIEFVNGEL